MPVSDEAPGGSWTDGWREFARAVGGEFLTSPGGGLERLLPADPKWQPTVRAPVDGWTLQLSASRRQQLRGWGAPSTRDAMLPCRHDTADLGFAVTTALALRYRSLDGFRFAIGPDGGDRIARMQRNVSFGAPVTLRQPLEGGLALHSPEPERAGPMFERSRIREPLAAFAALDAPGSLAIRQPRRWFGLRRARGESELRLEVAGFVTEAALLRMLFDLMVELFRELRRAGSVVEDYAGRR